MKKIIYILLAVLIAAALPLLSACADEPPAEGRETVERDNVLYALADDGASYSVVGSVGNAEALTVLAEIDGIPVTEIGNSAFAASKLKSVELPASITRIAAYAFDRCAELEAIAIPNGVGTIAYRAFYRCSSLAELSLPEALVSISSSAFEGCSSLRRVDLNSYGTRIGDNAFAECSAISELRVPSIALFCSTEFAGAYSNPLYFADKLIVAGSEVKELTVSDVAEIPAYAFYHFSGITSLTLGGAVKTVGSSAFSECTSLERITLGDSVEVLMTSAFSRLTSLVSVSFGRGIKDVGGLAFFGCTALRAVHVADLRAWCEAHFYTDNSGTSNPLFYADHLYVNGQRVTDLVIPEGTETVRALTFINLQTLTSVTIPSSVTVIEETAFYVVAGITRVYYNGGAEGWQNISIGMNNASFYIASRTPVFKS